MNGIRKPIEQARRRLILNRWLAALGWSVAGASALFVVAILVQRISFTGSHLSPFLNWFSLGVSILALLGSLVWAYIRRPNLATAAAALDVAAGLKERLSTGLYCQTSDDPFARAVLADAQRVGARISPKQHMPIRMPSSANYAGVSLGLALILLLAFPAVDLSGKEEAKPKDDAQRKQVEQLENKLQMDIAQRIQTISKENPTLAKDLDNLEPLQPTGADTPMDVRREVMKSIEKVNQKLEEKRTSKEMSEMEEMKKLLRRLAQRQNATETPVGKLANALSEGDFKEAKQVLDEIQQKLQKAPTNEAEKKQTEQLKKQLEQLAKQIQNIAEEDQKNRDELAKTGMNKQEVERALASLKKKDFDALKKQLEEKGLNKQQIQKMAQQMQKRMAAQDQAKGLGKKLAQGAQGAGQGQGEQPGQKQPGGNQSGGDQQGMSQASDQLSEMEALQQQLNELESAMAQMNQMQKSMGKGCSMCQGTGMRGGKLCGSCGGSGIGPPVQGQGGVAPEQQTAFSLKKERTKVISKPGEIIHQEYVEGEQFKGEVTPELKGAVMSAQRYATDAIERGDVPSMYQDVIGKYYNRSLDSGGEAGN